MLKKIIYTIAMLFIVVVLGYRMADEPLPEGKEGPKAEYLADQLLATLNYEAWKDLPAIAWSYPMGHDYIWDKKANLVQVSWEDYRVLLNPETRKGEAYKNGERITEEEQKIISKAFEYYANDSFWLIAPYKVKDPGTVRKVVNYEGEDALLVQYTSGGVTPGDAYLWLFDEMGYPYAWKFWVQIIPVGGIKYSWEHWEDVQGAKIATLHKGLLDIQITNLRSADHVADLNDGTDPFKSLRK